MRSRSAATLIVAAAVALALLALAATASRGLFGVGFDGEVARIEVRHEKHPPIDDVHLVHVGGDTTHVDRGLAAQLRPRDEIRKARLDRRVVVNGRSIDLRASRDLRRAGLAMPLMLLLTIAVLAVRHRV